MNPVREVVAAERGSVPIELSLGVALLVLPVALIVTLFPAWSERAAMARVAAQEAARVVALAGRLEDGTAAASALVEEIAANHGMADDVAGMDLVAQDLNGDGAADRGSIVTVSVQVRVPVTVVSFIGRAGGFTITGRHDEAVDAYRSIPAP